MPRWCEAVGVWLALSALGCAAIVDFPDEPQLVSESELVTESNLASDAAWRCLTDRGAMAPPAAPTARVRVQACDALRGCSTPLTGLTARVCGKLDVDCTSPLHTDIPDVAGAFEFDVPTGGSGFGGYLEVSSRTELCTSPVFGEAGPLACGLAPECNPEAPDAACSVPLYARALLFFNPPVTADFPEPMVLSMLSSAALPGLVRAAGGDFDPTTGNLLLTARDCTGATVAGITYDIGESPDPITQLYMDSGVLSSQRDATDATGMGAFVGVPSGFASVVAYDQTGMRIGAIGVQSAPATITYITLVPSP